MRWPIDRKLEPSGSKTTKGAPDDPQDPQLVGASEFGTTTVRTSSEPIAAGANGSITVSCLANEQVISGGGQPGHYGVEMTGTRPSGNGWVYQAKNQNGSDSTITAYALCLG